MPPDSLALTPVAGDPFNGGARYQYTPVEGNPFQQNMALADYARTLPAPAPAPLNDFGYAPPSAPQPALPGLASVAGDPSRSMAVRIPAAIGSSLADQGMGLAQSAWGAATLPGDVARGLVDPSSPEAIRRSTDLAGLLTLSAAGGEANPDIMGAMSGARGSKAFEGSKVVDAKGEPLTVYHGSNAEYDTMDPSQGTGGASWFTTDLGHAQSFGDVKPYHLNISNPLVLDMGNPSKMEASAVSAISKWAKENADNDGDIKIGSKYVSVGDDPVDKEKSR